MKHVFVGFLPWLIPWNLYANQSVSICVHDIFKKRLRAVTAVWTPHPTSRSRREVCGRGPWGFGRRSRGKRGIFANFFVGGLEHDFYDFPDFPYWAFIFPYIGNKMNNWRTPSFFRGVETTNQQLVLICRCQNGMCFSDFFNHKVHKALGIGTGMKQHEATNRLSSG